MRTTRSTRRLAVLTAALGTALLLSSCGQTKGEDDAQAGDIESRSLEVSFGWFPAFHTAAAFVADGAGYWKDQNLEVKMVSGSSGATLANLLSAGKLDLSYGSLESAARGREQGRDVMMIAPLGSAGSLNTVAKTSTLKKMGVSVSDPIEKRLAAFAKMKIGITAPHAPTDSYARMYMRMAGVDPDKNGTLIAAGSAGNLAAALKSGSIDAYMLTPPTSNIPEIEGFGSIFIRGTTGDIAELAKVPDTGLGAREEWLKEPENREAATRFIAGMIRAMSLIHSDFDKSLGYLKKYFPDMKPEVLRVGLKEMLPALSPDLTITKTNVANSLSVFSKYGVLDLKSEPSSDEGQLWTDDLLEAAKKRVEQSE